LLINIAAFNSENWTLQQLEEKLLDAVEMFERATFFELAVEVRTKIVGVGPEWVLIFLGTYVINNNLRI
jgi:hypothetical protein